MAGSRAPSGHPDPASQGSRARGFGGEQGRGFGGQSGGGFEGFHESPGSLDREDFARNLGDQRASGWRGGDFGGGGFRGRR